MPAPVALRIALFALLACNTIYFIFAGRLSEALESVAWYVLLILFTLEAACPHLAQSAATRRAMRSARLIATFAIGLTAVLYVREKEWLDAMNLMLWIAVVTLLEIEVWRPTLVAAHQRAFIVTAFALYGSLAVMVVIWLTLGKWMNAWDATGWLLAFALLENDMLRATTT